ncbi:MAG: head GIN domain-containing protein [Ferruginibacter sp.]
MKKYVVLVVLLTAGFIARGQNDFVVDANASLRSVTGDFNAIEVSNGIDLYLSQSNNLAVAISASKETIKAGIKTIVENGVLKIYYDGGRNWSKKDRVMRAYVSFVDLKKIDASGACDVVIAGKLTTADLNIKLSGACDFKGTVAVKILKINVSGASDAQITGTAETVDIESSGASDVKSFELVTDICNVHVSGASDVQITVNKELTARATGASDVQYKGNAVLKDKRSNGASSIAKVD